MFCLLTLPVVEVLMMENEASSWNDERLDELHRRVDEGFVCVDQRFVHLEGEMKAGFDKVDVKMKEGFAEVKGEIRYMGERFDRLSHALMVAGLSFGIGVFAALAGLIVALV
jgi:hypothetical protein